MKDSNQKYNSFSSMAHERMSTTSRQDFCAKRQGLSTQKLGIFKLSFGIS